MFIPLRTDRPPRRRPVVTELLIVVNLGVYLFGMAASYFGWVDLRTIIDLGRYGGDAEFAVWRLVTYQFLHDPSGIGHIAFNLLFLWIFGAAVEDRLGRIGFLGFYLIGGAVAALAHSMVSPAAVIGASGSIAGVTGAFLALFPRSRIKVLLFFIIIGIYTVPSLWFIGFYFVIDVLRQAMDLFGGGRGQVAYAAHLAGYVYGFAVAFVLLGTGLLKHEEFDVFYLFKQARRRAAFRAATRTSQGAMWDAPTADVDRQLAARESRKKPLTAEQQRQVEQRSRIGRLLDDHDVEGAAREYRALLERSDTAVLPERRQLDVANQLYSAGDPDTAARAYELFLKHYPAAPRSWEVRLLLGLLYARTLGRPDRARELLEAAKDRLGDSGQAALASQVLAELEA